MEKIYLDQEGYENYLKELDEIREKIRKNSSDISEYSSSDAYGDGWHDNFAYEQAIKKENSLFYELDKKIKGLSKIEIINKCKNSDKVEIGSVVTIEIDGEIEKYILTGNTNSDLESDIPMITLNSPLGKAIYKKNKNDKFLYTVNSNQFDGIILDVE